MNLKIKFVLFICFIQAITVCAQSEITNYLNIASPLIIDNKEYNLAWSAHPNQNYYKQEYLSNDQTLEKYTKMLLIECVLGNFKLEQVIQQKTNALDKLKDQNPLVNYQVYENKDEYILDFIVSENSADGEKPKL